MEKPNILDRAIMAVAPVHAAKRAAARAALSVINSGYGNYGANLTKKSMRGWMYHGGLMPAPQLDSDYLGLDEAAV